MHTHQDSVRTATFRLARKVGEEIAKKYPEVADYYAEGVTLKDLARGYAEDFDLRTESFGRSAMSWAIEAIIGREEMNKLTKRHLSESGKRQVRDRGGMWNGKTDFHTSGHSSALSQGFVPFDMTRIDSRYGKVTEGEYIIRARNAGLDFVQIVPLINWLFGNGRSYGSVRHFPQRHPELLTYNSKTL